MNILVSGDSLDIKELTYAIIINFILYIYTRDPDGRSAYSLKV